MQQHIHSNPIGVVEIVGIVEIVEGRSNRLLRRPDGSVTVPA